MALFQSATDKHQQSVYEEQLYSMAAAELVRGEPSVGLMAKAMAEAGGDQSKASARYLVLRVEALRLEAEAKFEATRNEELQIQRRLVEADKAAEQMEKQRARERALFGSPAIDKILTIFGYIVIILFVVSMIQKLLS